MIKWLISRILLECMILILSPPFPKPFFLSPAPSAQCPWQSHRRNYLISASCIANEKIVCFYCNLIYINIHSRIKFLKKKVSFSECPGTQQGAINRTVHKNLTFGKHCYKKASPVEIPSGKEKKKIWDHIGTPTSLLRNLCTEEIRGGTKLLPSIRGFCMLRWGTEERKGGKKRFNPAALPT